MTLIAGLVKIVQQEDISFLLTNRIPRRLLTRFMGWFSKIEQPLVRDISIAVWQRFCAVDLQDAAEIKFASMHACFIRRLRPGARPADPDPDALASPCDAIVGALGTVEHGMAAQVKGFRYRLADLLGGDADAAAFEGGSYITLRLTAGMYHHFHAPHDCRVLSVTHISGDTWNVNPIALRRIERLFCKNERGVIRLSLSRGGHLITLAPIAAILVASIRLAFLGPEARLRGLTSGTVACDVTLAKGEEMGWFEHGSTIVVFLPAGFVARVAAGETVRAGQMLAKLPPGC